MNFDMNIYQFLTLMVAVLGLVWGWHKYLVTRMDSGDKEAKKQTEDCAKELHERITKTRESMVPRHEFDREVNRFHTELRAVRDEVIESRGQQTARMDQILNFLVTNKKSD